MSRMWSWKGSFSLSAEKRHDALKALAKSEAPKSMGWTGLAVLVLGTVEFTVVDARLTAYVAHLALGLLIILAAWAATKDWTPAGVVPWMTATCAVLTGVTFSVEVLMNPTAIGLGYVLLVIIVYAPFTLNLRAATFAATPLVFGFVFASRFGDQSDGVEWVILALTGLLMGFVVLRLRILGVYTLAQSLDETARIATRDQHTGAFNRHGLDEHIPELVALAERGEASVWVAFVDIDGLKAANDLTSHAFGDEVIRTTYDAIAAVSRRGDLVGRWGGDEFIVFGLGEAPDPDVFRERVIERIHLSGIDLAKWPGTVSVGAAGQQASEYDFDKLIGEADIDMYARRARLRNPGQAV